MDENVYVTVFKLLKALNVPVTSTSVKKNFYHVPDFDSFYGISELLLKWNIDAAAYQLPFDELSNEYCPFIATVARNSFKEFLVVKSISEKGILCANEQAADFWVSKQEFKGIYTGTLLIAEPGESAGESDFKIARAKELADRAAKPIMILTIILALAYYFLNAGIDVFNFAMIGTKLAGLIIAGILVGKSSGVETFLFDKICKAGNTMDCNLVIEGKGSRLFSWLSFAEVGLIYFSLTLMLMIFHPQSAGILILLKGFNLITLPYIVFSLYQQAFVIKKWCILCCITLLCLLLEFSAFELYIPLIPFKLTTIDILSCLLTVTSIFALLLAGRRYLTADAELMNADKEVSRFKYDKEMFELILNAGEHVPPVPSGSVLTVGNPDAESVITIVSNPYCTPCVAMHKRVNKLLSVHKNIKVQIVLSDKSGDGRINHALATLQILGSEHMHQAIDDWYNGDKNYESWAERFLAKNDLSRGDDAVRQQKEWYDQANIEGTPKIIVRNTILPSVYKLEDLPYLI